MVVATTRVLVRQMGPSMPRGCDELPRELIGGVCERGHGTAVAGAASSTPIATPAVERRVVTGTHTIVLVQLLADIAARTYHDFDSLENALDGAPTTDLATVACIKSHDCTMRDVQGSSKCTSVDCAS